jgi:hypothetical protein
VGAQQPCIDGPGLAAAQQREVALDLLLQEGQD